MTDTADLVKFLREQAKRDSDKMFLPIDFYPEWQAADLIESTQARADKLEAEVERLRKKGSEAYALADNCNADKEKLEEELVEAKRQLASMAQGVKVTIPTATMLQEFKQHYDQGFAAGKQSAESSLTAANERVKELEGALSFYASPEVYRPHPHGPAFDRRDLSDVAVAALQKAREA